MPSERKTYTASDELEQVIPMEPEVAPPKPPDPVLLAARKLADRTLEQLPVSGFFLGRPCLLAVVRCPERDLTGPAEPATAAEETA